MKSLLTAWLLTSLLTLAATVSSNAQTPVTDAPVAVADSATLSAYVGTYTFDSASPIRNFTISVDTGTLYGEADDLGRNKLLKQPNADTYQSTSSYGSLIVFKRDATTNAVTHLTLAAQGMELTAKKENP